MAVARTCSNCGLLNPPDALACDCGYELPLMPVLEQPAEPVTLETPGNDKPTAVQVVETSDIVSDSGEHETDGDPEEPLPRQPALPVRSILFSYRERMNRANYWGWMIGLWITWVFTSSLIVGMGRIMMTSGGGWSTYYGVLAVWIGVAALIVWPISAVCAKRWHDVDRSGWWSLLVLMPPWPVIGLLVLFGLLGFWPGTKGPNKYGL